MRQVGSLPNMDRPTKRPRLSLFNRSSVGLECDNARYQNDMLLKSRFESIFAKYALDFTGIGDEVDIMTGEVIVNNGHLERMETETDPGIDGLPGDFTSTGRSMLRAMAVTLNPDLPGPDDVLASIETIAENAVMTEAMSVTESEDDLFDTSRPVSPSKSPSNAVGQDWLDTSIEPYNSDSDSLFEEASLKSGSPDSLFEDTNPSREESFTQDWVESTSYHTQSPNDDDEIIERFGPHVGKEVLTLIGQRQEAHIEPAWRIPVKLARQETSRPTPRTVSSLSYSGSPETGRNKSLWKPATTRNRKSLESSSMQSDSEESVDPLQEGFQSDSEHWDHGRASRTQPSNSESGFEDGDEDKDANIALIEIADTGHCPYCQTNFGCKSGVMAHWDRWLRQHQKKAKEDNSHDPQDPHDFETMKKIRATAVIRVRLPRLVVYDFRTMVELHEGAGMTFNEIAASNTLRTCKTALRLQGLYNSHRSPSCEGSFDKPRTWSKSEDKNLLELCKNPLATMTTLKRSLKGRNLLEIGNRLAEIWLAQLGVAAEHGQNHNSVTIESTIAEKAKEPSLAAGVMSSIEISERPMVKQEESEDSLFER